MKPTTAVLTTAYGWVLRQANFFDAVIPICVSLYRGTFFDGHPSMNACVQERAPVCKSEPSSSPSSSLSWSRWSGKSTWRKLGGIYLFVFHEPPKQVMFASQKKNAVGTGRRARPPALGIGRRRLSAGRSWGQGKFENMPSALGVGPAACARSPNEYENGNRAIGNQVEQSG